MLIFLAVGYTVFAVSTDLLNHAVHGLFSEFEHKKDDAADFLKIIWNIATRQEA